MDQLRKIFRWLKQQHFWVLSVLVALIAVVCRWSATKTLSAERDSNITSIAGQFSELATLRGKPFHPNENIQQEQIKQTKLQAEHVKETWQRLYDRQRENVLEWPAALSDEFRAYVESRSFGDDIPPDLRDNYQNYVERHFPKLPEKVGARVMAAGEGAGTYGGGGGGRYEGRGGGMMEYGAEGGMAGTQLEDEGDYLCEWLDQARVREELNFPERPSPTRIWVTQENLWVYHTLLQAIANTNKAAGATRMSNAAIRIIYSLDVGPSAAMTSRGKGRILVLASPAAGDPTMMTDGAGGEMAGGMDTASRYGQMPGAESLTSEFSRGGAYGGMSTGPMSPDQERAMLVAGRYIDAQGMPIGGAAGADPAMSADPSAGGDPAAAVAPAPTEFGTEYKRLPVRMALKMDQRWLTRLISECANQPLQIEVQEVRINPSGGVGAEGGGAASYGPSSYGGGGYGRGGDMGGMSGGAGASLFSDRTGIQTFPAHPNIVDVIIQGVIYIFNPPDPEVLKTPEDQEQGGLAATDQ